MQQRSKFQVRSDAAKQRWVRDDRKEAFWRAHVVAWKKSGLSKRSYCLKNDLSQSSFNAWSREIAIRDREKVSSASAQALLSPPKGKNPFVPLRLLPEESAAENPPAPAKPAGAVNGLEILVPGGAVIKIADRMSLDLVVDLFSSLRK